MEHTLEWVKDEVDGHEERLRWQEEKLERMEQVTSQARGENRKLRSLQCSFFKHMHG